MTPRRRTSILLPVAALAFALATGGIAQDLESLGPEAIAIMRAEIEELEFQRTDLADRIGVLDAELAAGRAERDAAAAELAGLREAVDAARAALDEAGDRQAMLERLEREISDRAAERARAEDDLARTRQALAEAEAALGAASEARDARLAEVEDVVAAAEARRAALEAEIAEARAQLAELGAARDAARAELVAIEARSREAAAEPAAAAAVPAPPPPPMVPEAALAERGQGAPRPQEAVTAAIASAPGLETADDPVLAALAADLAGGACVTDALDDAMGRINRWTAASLVRALGDC